MKNNNFKHSVYHRAVLVQRNKSLYRKYKDRRTKAVLLPSFAVSGLEFREINVFLYQSVEFRNISPDKNIYWEVSCVGDGNIDAIYNFLKEDGIEVYIFHDAPNIKVIK